MTYDNEAQYGQAYSYGEQELRRDCWRRACLFDNIDPSSKFVVFSKDNPWAELLDRFNEMKEENDK